MNKIKAITIVGIKQVLSDPMYMMFLLGLPVLMTWVMSLMPAEVYEMAILGVLVMFVALNILTWAGGYIIEEKKTGTWDRILSSKTSYIQIMTGYFIRIFIMAFAQSAILLLSGKYLFGAPWNYGFASILLVLCVYIFSMTGLGLFLAGILKSSGQVQAVSMAIVMTGTMLGGVMFTIDNPSAIINFITTISPQSWAAHAMRDILTTGVSPDLLTPILWMTGLGTFLLLGGVMINKIKT